MDKLLYYSVLKYIPSVIRMESINVGIAVHYPSKKYSHFFKTSNMQRVRAFDDEYDSDFFHMVMETLEYEIDFGKLDDLSLNLIDKSQETRFKDIEEESFLNKRTSYLANEFRFTPVQSISTNDEEVESDIYSLKDMYLYYDKPKAKRITKKEVHSLLAKQLRSYNLSNVKKAPVYKDELGGKVKYDYRINNNTLLRSITFDYKNVDSLSKELKVLLYDLKEINDSKISNIFLIRNDNFKNDSYQTIYTNFLEKISEINGKDETKHKKIKVFPLSELAQNLNSEMSVIK